MSKTWARIFTGATELGLRIFLPERRWIIRSLIFGRMKGTLPVSTRHGELKFHICNRQTLTFARDFETFEPDTLHWIDQLPDSAVLWDIGANVGMFSLYAALRPEIRVVSFEPGAATYDTLTRNIQLNGMASRVSAYSIALGDQTRRNVFRMSSFEPGHYMHGLANSEGSVGSETVGHLEQSVLEMSIDDFIAAFSPPLPTHIKLDVDSNENEIIAGAAGLLGGDAVQSIHIELIGGFEDPRNDKIRESLQVHGFQPVKKDDDGYWNVEFRRA